MGRQIIDERHHGVLSIGTGVHVGEPVEEHNDLFAATVQIAARVCQTAAPETVVVSGAVRDLIGGQFVFSEPEHFYLKGVTAPVMQYQVDWRHLPDIAPT